jgi:hypothetical protein
VRGGQAVGNRQQRAPDMPKRFDPARMIDDVVFLRKAHEVLNSLARMRHEQLLEEKEQALAAAERDVARWHARRETKPAQCALPAGCTDARCRRARSCKALPMIASKVAAAEMRLAAERARWPAPEGDALPSQSAAETRGESRKPGRARSTAPGSRRRALRVPG